MSKFNTARKNNSPSYDTTNKSGLPAFLMEDKEKLVSQVLTTFFNESKFYGDNSKELVALVREVVKTDPKFIANLALYARRAMHLRSVSHVLTAELANAVEGKPYVRKLVNEIVERPDDMSEIVAYFLTTFQNPKAVPSPFRNKPPKGIKKQIKNKMFPNSLKKGLADVFFKFDEYTLAKYNRDHSVKLVDVLRLVHPKPKTTLHTELFHKLINDELSTPVTWETQVSANGNTKEVWENLIENKQLGYMAMLRNLRNIVKSQVNNMHQVYAYLSNPVAVLNSKQLPFRYATAYRTLKNENLGTSKLYNALEQAIKISCQNIEQLKGVTLIAGDVSASMNCTVSRKSNVTCSEIAVLLLSIGNYICEEAILKTFDTELYDVTLPSTNGIISNSLSIDSDGGGTNITLPLAWLLNNKIKVDRIILLSDNEINSDWNGYGDSCQKIIDKYRNTINKDVWVHAIDLCGYGTQQFKGTKTNIIAGWTEKVFEFINLAEAGFDTMVATIDNYYFTENIKQSNK